MDDQRDRTDVRRQPGSLIHRFQARPHTLRTRATEPGDPQYVPIDELPTLSILRWLELSPAGARLGRTGSPPAGVGTCAGAIHTGAAPPDCVPSSRIAYSWPASNNALSTRYLWGMSTSYRAASGRTAPPPLHSQPRSSTLVSSRVDPAREGADSNMTPNLVIVPAYNEAEAISATIHAIYQQAPHFDVLVVDDGSTDATFERARAAGAAGGRLPFNLAIGGAMQSGYIYAREHNYEVAVQVDGDGQHDPRYIGKLLARLQGDPQLNMVTGSRFLDPDGDGHRSSAARRVGIRVFARVVSRLPGRLGTDA